MSLGGWKPPSQGGRVRPGSRRERGWPAQESPPSDRSAAGLMRDLRRSLGETSISILSRDPNLFREPSEPQGKQRSVFEKNDG